MQQVMTQGEGEELCVRALGVLHSIAPLLDLSRSIVIIWISLKLWIKPALI